MKTNAPVPPPVPGVPAAPAGTNAPVPPELHDIVGPVGIIDLRQALIFAAILLVVLGLAAFLARLWWKRRKARLAAAPVGPPPLPPHERARRRLDEALRHLDDPNLYCTVLSAVLREYIEERFGWNAPDRTTEEFLLEVRERAELGPSHKDLLQDFLSRCDFVKFARYEPTETELRDLHGAAVRFVNDTVPPPPPPPGSVAPELLPSMAGPGRGQPKP